MFRISAATFVITLFQVGIVPAQDWPQFRGPDGNGVLKTLQHPESWGEGENIAWSVAVPGGGLSSPIATAGRVFLTSAVGVKPPVSFAEGVRDMRPKRPDQPVKFTLFSPFVITPSLQEVIS